MSTARPPIDAAAALAGSDAEPVAPTDQEPRAASSIETDADAEQRFQREVQAHLPRNFAAHLIHGLLGQAGFRIIEAPTLLPAYVFQLSGSTALVGLVRTCQAIGTLSSPLIGASLVEKRRKVLPLVFITGTGMRLPLLGVALCGFFLGATANLWALCILMALFGLFQGMQGVTFSFLVSKIIPVERRGALGGVRNTLAGAVAASVGVVSGYLIQNNTLGNGYATAFLIGFVLTALGLLSLTLLREPASPTVKARSELGTRLRELPALLRADPDYRAYVLGRALGATGRMSVPYYVIYAGEVMHLPGESIGWLTGAFIVSQTASNLVWGVIGDRRGFRDVLVSALVVWIGSTVLFLYAGGFAAVVLGFVGLGMGLGGFQLASTNLVLEFGTREDLPMRIAMAQTAEQLITVLAPIGGGLLIQALSYGHMFWISASLQLFALAVTLRYVKEPRRRGKPRPEPAVVD